MAASTGSHHGRKKVLCQVHNRGENYSFAPLGLPHFPNLPTAYAVGCILAPLRGYESLSLDQRYCEIRVLTRIPWGSVRRATRLLAVPHVRQFPLPALNSKASTSHGNSANQLDSGTNRAGTIDSG